MSDREKIRLFVAMPGTDMGPNAQYKNPESVKKNLIVPVVRILSDRLGNNVELTIEKEEIRSETIPTSMFAEAYEADVYIADLTGANPNVYLELGARWAIRDNVTILICQSVRDLKFNVSSNRVLIYNPDNIMESIENVVRSIKNGLMHRHIDSPIKLNSGYVVMNRGEHDNIRNTISNLEEKIDNLTKLRGQDLFSAALSTNDLNEKSTMLKKVIDVNPGHLGAMVALGQINRALALYDEAISILIRARNIDNTREEIHRELGVSYSKQGNVVSAVDSLREAVRLNPIDQESWCNLGGALRRLGIADGNQSNNLNFLVEARECYSRAASIDRFNSYAILNMGRMDLILSKWEPSKANDAEKIFANCEHLCRHLSQAEPSDFWKKFDLGDALLFSGNYDEASTIYNEAIEMVPMYLRKDVFESVAGPLRTLQAVDLLKEDIKINVKKFIEKLEDAIVYIKVA